MEKGPLLTALWILAMPLKASAQTNDPPIAGGCHVIFPANASIVEYSCKSTLIWKVTPTSTMDVDLTKSRLEIMLSICSIMARAPAPIA